MLPVTSDEWQESELNSISVMDLKKEKGFKGRYSKGGV